MLVIVAADKGVFTHQGAKVPSEICLPEAFQNFRHFCRSEEGEGGGEGDQNMV